VPSLRSRWHVGRVPWITWPVSASTSRIDAQGRVIDAPLTAQIVALRPALILVLSDTVDSKAWARQTCHSYSDQVLLAGQMNGPPIAIVRLRSRAAAIVGFVAIVRRRV
jgi:hypothetical protein